MKALLAALVSIASQIQTAAQPPPQPPGPQVSVTLKDARGQATPLRQGFTHTGGGNIDVAQPSPDTVIVTMSAVAVAGAHPCQNSLAWMTFELDQGFEISIDNPKIKRVRVTLEGRVIGLLRSHKGGGTAQQGPAHANVASGLVNIVSIALPNHCVTEGQNLSVNDRHGPVTATVAQGCSISTRPSPSWQAIPGLCCRAKPARRNLLLIPPWTPFGSATGSRSTGQTRKTLASR